MGLLLLALLHGFGQFSTIIRKQPELTGKPLATTDYWTAFNHLPDSESVCAITLLVQKAWDPLSGHAFLQLTKSDGPDSVIQYVGFYRQNPKQALFSDEPVPARLIDDAYHTYHASLRRQITPAELRVVLQELQRLSTVRYQTFHFNSVDFALRLMDQLRLTNPLLLTGRSATPGRLYRLLKKRKMGRVDPTETILIARGLQYASGSHTPITLSAVVHHP
jgi:hypothetical protein